MITLEIMHNKRILHLILLELRINLRIFSQNPLMRINLSILEDNYESSLCEKLLNDLSVNIA